MKRRTAYGDSHIKFRQARQFRQEMTPSEGLLWSRLRGNRLLDLHFHRPHVIRGFNLDFYYHEARLVVEMDGSVHKSRLNIDKRRDAILMADGLTVFHCKAEAVERNPEEARKLIEGKCREQFTQ
ncbi:MAG: DUF559 domain-containing protein [Anaerolineales bacterium]